MSKVVFEVVILSIQLIEYRWLWNQNSDFSSNRHGSRSSLMTSFLIVVVLSVPFKGQFALWLWESCPVAQPRAHSFNLLILEAFKSFLTFLN